MVGSPVCAAHGAKAPRARELAEQRELIAEIMHANPDLTLREIFVRAAGVATQVAEDCDSASSRRFGASRRCGGSATRRRCRAG